MNKKNIILVLISVSILISLGACSGSTANEPVQTSGTNADTPGQLSVVGTGKVYLVPDVAYIYIGVRSESENVGNALDDNSIQAQGIAATFKEMGVDALDIQTTAFNVYPQQEYSPMGEVMGTKYIVENTIYVTVRDLQNLGRMLDAVVSSGANSINGIQFDVVDKSIATSEARRLAAEDAKTQAQELAEAADVELGRILSLNAYSMGSPVQVFEAKVFQGHGGGNVPVAAGQLVLSMDANIVYEIE